MTVIIAHSAEPAKVAKRLANNQERLEAIFHTVDTIKSDLNKCGMRLQEVNRLFQFSCFTTLDKGFSCKYGIADEILPYASFKGDNVINLEKQNDFFKAGKKVIIFTGDVNEGTMEINTIVSNHENFITLKEPLQSNYAANSAIIVLKTVSYRFSQKSQTLQRKCDNGKFQSLLENCSDFYVTKFDEANSVLYRIECGKEQIRGYIFLLNNVA